MQILTFVISLFTLGCEEVVTWVVFEKPIQIWQHQVFDILAFFAYLHICNLYKAEFHIHVS